MSKNFLPDDRRLNEIYGKDKGILSYQKERIAKP